MNFYDKRLDEVLDVINNYKEFRDKYFDIIEYLEEKRENVRRVISKYNFHPLYTTLLLGLNYREIDDTLKILDNSSVQIEFMLEDYGFLPYKPDFLVNGGNIKVKAKVYKYNEVQDIFFLKPILVEAR